MLVCAARAIAHSAGVVRAFSDPTALELLPEQARAMVEAHRAGPPKKLRARFRYEFMVARAAMMAVRTVVIDEAVRDAGAPQVVILGAGFDGRALRMSELRSATVYEVDHPDTQREKRTRTGSLAQQARELKFVAVDFTRDDLGERTPRHSLPGGTSRPWRATAASFQDRLMASPMPVFSPCPPTGL